MRYRVTQLAEAEVQLRNLAPEPKRRVRRKLREMTIDPYCPGTLQLERPEILFRVRVGDYRIIFEPGPGVREVSVIRIGHRDWVYQELERLAEDE